MIHVPTIVYRAGHKKDRHFSKWGLWSSKGVNTLEEYHQALADGWHATQAQAFGIEKPAPARVLAAVDEDQTYDDEAPPTREEMLAKAAELGMAVDKRWSDRTLANRILEAMK